MTGGQSAATAGTPSTRLAGTPGSPPVRFTQDILAAARAAGITAGLYIGCGNGRNYLPLTAAGLDLTGVDISAAAITQLTARAPQRRHQLILGDLTTLPTGARYPLVIGIQVFQHGDRAAAHAHIRAAQEAGRPRWPVLPAGQRHRHRHLARARGDRTRPGRRADRPLPEPDPSRAWTSTSSAPRNWTPSSPVASRRSCHLRLQRTWRGPPQPGQWAQWEAIWRKTS